MRTFINDREVCRRLGISRTKLWELERDDATFPKPIRIGKASKRRCEEELDAYMGALLARRDEEVQQ